MKSDISIEINAPIDLVFVCATEHLVEWSLICIEDEVLHETPEGVGTTFRLVTEDRGRRMEFQGIVTAREEPTHTAVTMRGKSFDIHTAYLLEDLGGRTGLRQVTNVEGKGLTKLMLTLFGWMMNKGACESGNKELESLKVYAEEKAASQ